MADDAALTAGVAVQIKTNDYTLERRIAGRRATVWKVSDGRQAVVKLVGEEWFLTLWQSELEVVGE